MIVLVYGTRPELIKLYPIILQLKKNNLSHKIIFSGQHKELVNDIIRKLKIKNDFCLNIFKKNQDLNISISKIISNLNALFLNLSPKAIVVQGDTLTAYAAAIAAFNLKIKIAHVEAGLRTGNINSPFPEEMFRVIISKLAYLHFCPTINSKKNILKEGIKRNYFLTGNTVVDSLKIISKSINLNLLKKYFSNIYKIDFSKKIILFTCHRRENYGTEFESICLSIKKISELNDINIVYPLHLNPNFYNKAKKYLGSLKNVCLIPNQNYAELLFLIMISELVITDSGGIQEEAPSFQKKILIIREHTERTEGLKKNAVELVGTNTHKIFNRCKSFLKDKSKISYKNPYGDGRSASRIIKILKENFF